MEGIIVFGPPPVKIIGQERLEAEFDIHYSIFSVRLRLCFTKQG
jgi:hypothetical protein